MFFEEDPTVIELEELASRMFGKQAALFCPSGTMTNQIAIKISTTSPGELICSELAHIYQYEGGGISFNSGLSVNLLKSPRGLLTAEEVEGSINPDDVHKAETQLVCVENTCNKGGGSIYALSQLESIEKVCRENNLKYHLDGARLFNAMVENDTKASDYGNLFDTISICLSKGLGAPVGSLLLGSDDDIKKARRIRKIFGGGMRQAGYLAAAGIYALKNNIERLKEDHDRASVLGKVLHEQNYIQDVLPVETNIVVGKLVNEVKTEDFLAFLRAEKIEAVPFGPGQIRFVLHLDIDNEKLSYVADKLRSFSV